MQFSEVRQGLWSGAALLLAGAWGSFLVPESARAEDAVVKLGHDHLMPAEVRVDVGESVTFHNLHKMPGGHSVKALDASFASPPLDKDERWSHTFEVPGRYPYYVVEHPASKGVVEVRDPSESE